MDIITNVTTDMIVVALLNKNKKDFKRLNKEMEKHAQSIDPHYRNLIYKIITSSALRISQKYRDGYIESLDYQLTNSLSKRKKNHVVVDIREDDTLFHEIGHAVDFWFHKPLTSNVILSNGKTLREIFDEELESKHQEIFDMVMNEYRDIINNAVYDNAFEVIFHNINTYHRLKSENDPGKRRELQLKLYKSGFMEAYYQITLKDCSRRINKKYSIVLDALSSKHVMDEFNLICHKREYYQDVPEVAVEEFFAHAFRMKVKGCLYTNTFMRSLLPNSFKYFDELFDIFYRHMELNKRFTDVPLKGDN